MQSKGVEGVLHRVSTPAREEGEELSDPYGISSAHPYEASKLRNQIVFFVLCATEGKGFA